MALSRVTKHTAMVRGVSESGNRVEGERDEEPVDGPLFKCVFFVAGAREQGRGGRRLEQPILMHEGFDMVGGELRLTARDVIELVDAPGLDPISLGRYEVDGDPPPLGKPGNALGAGLKGYLVNLRRVQGGSSGSA